MATIEKVVRGMAVSVNRVTVCVERDEVYRTATVVVYGYCSMAEQASVERVATVLADRARKLLGNDWRVVPWESHWSVV